MKPFFGYPGGKSKVAAEIASILNLDELDYRDYAEPFAGGFSMGLYLAPERPWINDYDKDLYCLWYAVINHTEELCDQVMAVDPSPEMFYELREKINGHSGFCQCQVMERAIDKLVIHKISFSNMGEKSGSPVGGKKQTGDWKFDERWKPERICGYIRKTAALLEGARVTCHSYERVVRSRYSNLLLYVDPPYVEGGRKNYKHFFQEEDHRRLSWSLASCDHYWFATYDNDPLVRELYKEFNIQEYKFKYHMSSRGKAGEPLREATELLISNF